MSSSGGVALTVGYHAGVTMDDYVHDRISPEPSVSTGIIDALVTRSPLHAWQAHPRLSGGSDDATSRGDLGSAVHAAVFGGAEIVYVEADDWRTKAAKERRDEARAAGMIPVLLKHRGAISAMLESVCKALAPFGPGRSEETMLWRDELGVWCRARADFLTTDDKYDLDLKTCTSADPETWAKSTLVQGGYDIQAGLRARGHYALTGRNRDVLFLLAEIEPPYACSVVGLDPAFQDLAARKVQRGLELWAKHLKSNRWPGYDTRIHYAEPPGWAEHSFVQRAAREVA